MSSMPSDVFVADPVTVMLAPGHADAGLHTAAQTTAGGGMHSTVQLPVAGGLEVPHSFVAVAEPLKVTVPGGGQVGIVLVTTCVTLVFGSTFRNVRESPSIVMVMSSEDREQLVAVPVTVIGEPAQARTGLQTTTRVTHGGSIHSRLAPEVSTSVLAAPPSTHCDWKVAIASDMFRTSPKQAVPLRRAWNVIAHD
jgi:hypothetical protein